MLAAVLLSATLSAPPAVAPPVAGDTCVLTKPAKLSANEKLRGKKTPVKKGVQLEVVSVAGPIVEVRESESRGFIKLGELRRFCKPVPKAPAAAASPSPTPPAPAVEPAPPAVEPAPPPAGPPAAPPPAVAPAPEITPAAPAAAPTVEQPPTSTPEAAPGPVAVVAPEKGDDSGKTKVAVLAIRASKGMAGELVDTLTNVIPQALEELGPFKAITSNDIQQMLAMETLKQSLGCDQVSCLAEIGGAIGADYMVTGNVIDVGGAFLVQLQLMNIRDAKVTSRVSRDYSGGAKGLLDEMRMATKLLVRDILAEKSGTLALSVSEEGATVKIDGSIVGVSPMQPFAVGGGLHTLSIEKQGFVVFSRDVDIHAKRESQVAAALVPSEEYRRAYADGAARTRLFAWLGLALGVAGLGGGTATFLVAKGNAEVLRRDIIRFNDPAYAKTPEEERQLTSRRRGVASLDALTLGLGALGVVAVATGAILFFTGDDPDRFDTLTTVESPPRAALQDLRFFVSPAGIALGGCF